jgi:hypothetical protein
MCGTESSNLMHWFMIRCNANLAYFHSGLTGIRDGTLLRASSILIELIPPGEQDPVSVWRFCGAWELNIYGRASPVGTFDYDLAMVPLYNRFRNGQT